MAARHIDVPTAEQPVLAAAGADLPAQHDGRVLHPVQRLGLASVMGDHCDTIPVKILFPRSNRSEGVRAGLRSARSRGWTVVGRRRVGWERKT